MSATLTTTLYNLGLPATLRPYLWVTLSALVAITLIEPNPWFQRSIRRMALAGVLLALLKWLATAATMVVLLLIPFERLRALILGSLAFCGGLTLLRELVWRARSGDRSWSSYIGAFSVSIQTMSLLLLAASIIAALIEVVIAPARILESDLNLMDGVRGWVEVLATILTLVSGYYVGYALVRRILSVTGFSWVDPPNWRTILPHLKYTIALQPRWPFVGQSEVADAIRATYVEHIVGSASPADIAAAARIRPVRHPEQGFTCAVLGDPGEGDRSQIRPVLQQPEISQAMQQSAPAAPPNEGFILICSDIVYPAGELMDYERTVYRPYRNQPGGAQPLIYGLPGNHDWYNNLKGMLVNFGLPAAFPAQASAAEARWSQGLRTGPWARYGMPWGRLRWSEARSMRRTYNLDTLGGDPARPATQQRLPFWEIDVQPAPLTILGIDTGAVGSLDALQSAWLDDCLRRASAANTILVVLLSEPLYVDGQFVDSAAMRDLYVRLRQHNVAVVMGGDTHAYQHYAVSWQDADGASRLTHHFVNGGGGAFLAPPIDLHWRAALPLPPTELAWNFKDPDHGIDDKIVLNNYFPSAEQLREKFAGAGSGPLLRRRLRQFEGQLLGRGFTTALDHDRAPLFQSFVALTMIPPPEGWLLRLTPWFTTGPDSVLQPQPSIDVPAPGAASLAS